jgi:ubiquitin C-terminal hydrolase
LLLCLKRFGTDGAKKASPASAPYDVHEYLDLTEVCFHNQKKYQLTYRLMGVVCHAGSERSGHYATFGRDSLAADKWFIFDDEFVRAVPGAIDKVDTRNAYLLAYERFVTVP